MSLNNLGIVLNVTLLYNKGANLVNQNMLRDRFKHDAYQQVVKEHWTALPFDWIKWNIDVSRIER